MGYMIKTKDVVGLFVSVKEEPKVEEPAPVEEVEASLRRTPMPRRRRRRSRRPPSKLFAVFSTFVPRLWLPLKRHPTLKTPHSKKNGRYEGIRDQPRSNNIVSWYLTSTDISFIKIRNLPIKIFYCGKCIICLEEGS